MTIGGLSKATGIGIDAIRFYEKTGLLPKPARRESGYREYTDEDRQRLAFVARARELEFSLDEITELLRLRTPGSDGVPKVRRLVQTKLEGLDKKIRELRQLRRALDELVSACPGTGDLDACPILNAFSAGRRSAR
jgi:MerR family copper efflux transcriptional regulator